MTSEEFKSIVDRQMITCDTVLFSKAKEYAKDDDRLHNFKVAAALMGDTPIKALAGMMRKHTVSIYDMCESGQDYPIELWDEKITDHINYLLLLKAAIMEGKANANKISIEDKFANVNIFDGSEV